jgi:hypothetical protein
MCHTACYSRVNVTFMRWLTARNRAVSAHARRRCGQGRVHHLNLPAGPGDLSPYPAGPHGPPAAMAQPPRRSARSRRTPPTTTTRKASPAPGNKQHALPQKITPGFRFRSRWMWHGRAADRRRVSHPEGIRLIFTLSSAYQARADASRTRVLPLLRVKEVHIQSRRPMITDTTRGGYPLGVSPGRLDSG